MNTLIISNKSDRDRVRLIIIPSLYDDECQRKKEEEEEDDEKTDLICIYANTLWKFQVA